MIVKKYYDGSYNLQYEVGDLVRINPKKKYGMDDTFQPFFGKIVKMMGKPLTAKLFLENDGKKAQSFAWDVSPCDENGQPLTQEQILETGKITESFNLNIDISQSDNSIIKFSDL
jgi:hypothetical protein